MKERGMTGGGRPQITGVPPVYRHLKRVLRGYGMTERGTAGAGEHQITGVPQRGTNGTDICLGQVTSPAMTHGRMVTDKAK